VEHSNTSPGKPEETNTISIFEIISDWLFSRKEADSKKGNATIPIKSPVSGERMAEYAQQTVVDEDY
jgi:hypothetical protein